MNEARTILISDDEVLMTRTLARAFQRVGVQPLVENDSAKIVQRAADEQPHFILLDVHQKLDGRDVLAALKRNPHTADIPVFMLSGWDDQFVRRTCLELGAEDFDLKPFDALHIDKLMRKVGLSKRLTPNTNVTPFVA